MFSALSIFFLKKFIKILPINLRSTFETRKTKSGGSLLSQSYDHRVELKLNKVFSLFNFSYSNSVVPRTTLGIRQKVEKIKANFFERFSNVLKFFSGTFSTFTVWTYWPYRIRQSVCRLTVLLTCCCSAGWFSADCGKSYVESGGKGTCYGNDVLSDWQPCATSVLVQRPCPCWPIRPKASSSAHWYVGLQSPALFLISMGFYVIINYYVVHYSSRSRYKRLQSRNYYINKY